MNTAIGRKRLDEPLAMAVIILMATGAVMVFSASANLSQELNLRNFYEFTQLRQILFFPLALAVMYVTSLLDYHRFSLAEGWRKSFTPYLLGLAIAALTIVLVPGIGAEVNYVRRWLHIPLGPIVLSFQPSELAKWAVILFLAAFCHKFTYSMHLFWRRFVPACLVIGVVVGLIVTQDFGTAVFIALLAFLILVIGGAKRRYFLVPIPVLAVVFYLAIAGSASRIQRILAFINPAKWADSAGYQARQSLIAIATGGIWGKGLGLGICKYGHLPEDTTDFIFAIIAEELGFVGAAGVIGLFAAFVLLGILVVARCRDRFGRLLAAGIVLTIGIQAAFNIGVVMALVPTKGIPLPFVSAGATSMLLSAAAVGVLLNIAKQTALPQTRELQNE